MNTGSYDTAETTFKAIIDQYPDSKYAKESAKKLIPLTKLSDQDFPGLMTYYDTTATLHQDSGTSHLVYRLKNKCTVEMDQYEQAITWFEQDILAPSSEQDSLFSLIDLSDTYMLMEADSSLKSTPAYTGLLAQYKPQNRESYIKLREEWVRMLFSDDAFIQEELDPWNQDETNLIKQIIPNPCDESTEIYVEIPAVGETCLTAYNLLGQEIKTITQYFTTPGTYTIVLDLSGFPDGIYLITLSFNGSVSGNAKLIKFN